MVLKFKINYLFVTALILAFHFFSCTQTKQKTEEGFITIHGHTFLQQNKILFLYGYTDSASIYFSIPLKIDSASIDHHGNYSFKTKINKTTICELQLADSVIVPCLYLVPGNELEINFGEEKAVAEISVNSINGKYNGYFEKYFNRFYREPETKYFYYISSNYLTIDQFEKYISDRKNQELSFFKDYFKNDSIDESFRNFALNQIEYMYATDKIYWVIKKRMKGESIKIAFDYFNFLTPEFLNNDRALLSQAYIKFLIFYIKDVYERKVESEIASGRMPSFDTSIEKYKIAKNNLKGAALRVVLLNLAKDDLKPEYIFHFQKEKSLDSLLKNFISKYSLNNF